jgi:hypothetical protein
MNREEITENWTDLIDYLNDAKDYAEEIQRSLENGEIVNEETVNDLENNLENTSQYVSNYEMISSLRELTIKGVNQEDNE